MLAIVILKINEIIFQSYFCDTVALIQTSNFNNLYLFLKAKLVFFFLLEALETALPSLTAHNPQDIGKVNT